MASNPGQHLTISQWLNYSALTTSQKVTFLGVARIILLALSARFCVAYLAIRQAEETLQILLVLTTFMDIIQVYVTYVTYLSSKGKSQIRKRWILCDLASLIMYGVLVLGVVSLMPSWAFYPMVGVAASYVLVLMCYWQAMVCLKRLELEMHNHNQAMHNQDISGKFGFAVSLL